MTEPSGITLQYGDNFESSAVRVQGEQAERADLVKREIKFHMAFLDDSIRGILPHDLILLGAASGAGKTELAKQIAMFNAWNGKVVHYFALEAEPKEIERRIKFSLLTEYARQSAKAEGRTIETHRFNYADWYRGKLEKDLGPFNEEAEAAMSKLLVNLRTYYRGSNFGTRDLERLLLSIQTDTDLVVLDHFHYVDVDDDNENRGGLQLVKTIRDTALGMGKPMIVVAHLRKKQSGGKQPIVPDLDSFHGTSNLTKIATHAVMLAPAYALPSTQPRFANTFIHVPKDRANGATGLVAMCQFEFATRTYRKKYTLGRATPDGSDFEVLDRERVPFWAVNHEGLS